MKEDWDGDVVRRLPPDEADRSELGRLEGWIRRHEFAYNDRPVPRTPMVARLAAALALLIVIGAFGVFNLERLGSRQPGPAASSSPSLRTPRVSPKPTVFPTEAVATPGLANPPPQGRWQLLPSMAVPRIGFTATLMQDGRVLIVGGRTRTFAVSPDGSPTSIVEIFDPVSSTFSRAAGLRTPRAGHTATLLASGKVLVAGGDPAGTAEIYDPSTNSWTLAGPMHGRRYDHAAALLLDGKVLVTGGGASPPIGISSRGARTASTPAEIYDPATDTWYLAATPALDRPEYPTATTLLDGRVLVVGGQYMYSSADESTETSEIYDPASNRWSFTAPETSTGARQYHTATLLQDGRVLVAGGFRDGVSVSWSALYDPVSDSWTRLPTMNVGRCGHAAQMLRDGRVLVAGSGCWSDTGASAEEFDPVSSRWYLVATLAYPQGKLVAVALLDGRVLAVGGGMEANNPSAVAEVFQPA